MSLFAGPFGAHDMKEWFVAGYFTLNLLVKRACDPQFITLGDLMAKWGGMPFDKKHGLSPQVGPFWLTWLYFSKQSLVFKVLRSKVFCCQPHFIGHVFSLKTLSCEATFYSNMFCDC